jgi:hypothetical protein
MIDTDCRVLDYLAYKNKVQTNEWVERLWRAHLGGAMRDFRDDLDRQRYTALSARLEQSRPLARSLHAWRTRHAPQFGYSAMINSTSSHRAAHTEASAPEMIMPPAESARRA